MTTEQIIILVAIWWSGALAYLYRAREVFIDVIPDIYAGAMGRAFGWVMAWIICWLWPLYVLAELLFPPLRIVPVEKRNRRSGRCPNKP